MPRGDGIDNRKKLVAGQPLPVVAADFQGGGMVGNHGGVFGPEVEKVVGRADGSGKAQDEKESKTQDRSDILAL